MVELDHSPEPWKFREIRYSNFKTRGFSVKSANGGLIREELFANIRAMANFKRIVACVNACQDLSNEELEQGLKPRLKPDLEWLMRAIQVFREDPYVRFLPEADYDYGMASHILGNWLMIEEARESKKERR